MLLSTDEAICLVLKLSKGNKINSKTKLNKLLARLNLFLIPIDIDFDLNKYGSFNAELDELESTKYYTISQYSYKGQNVNEYALTKEGNDLYASLLDKKINKIFNLDEYKQLSDTIEELSQLRASEISENEHEMLLVDVDERAKLIRKANSLSVELFDLNKEINNIKDDSISNVRLKALIEYCYQMSLYLKNKFNKLDDKYDFEAHMFDYYFLFHIGNLVELIKKGTNPHTINRYYHYIIYSVKDRYPFSVDNPNFKNIMAG